MDDLYWKNKEFIAREAEAIKERIRGGHVYGKPIDMNDLNDVMVAAYSLGMLEHIGNNMVGTRTMSKEEILKFLDEGN